MSCDGDRSSRRNRPSARKKGLAIARNVSRLAREEGLGGTQATNMLQRNQFLLVQLLTLVCSSAVLFSYRANRWHSVVSPCHGLQHPVSEESTTSSACLSERPNLAALSASNPRLPPCDQPRIQRRCPAQDHSATPPSAHVSCQSRNI
ncbi:hypothetical protein MTO96_049215 [Rhipicephalus appendiculatus]